MGCNTCLPCMMRNNNVNAYELSNEELAKAIMSRVPLDSNNHDDIRAAASRLRKIDTFISVNEQQDKDNTELRRLLKLAEDALWKSIVWHCENAEVDGHGEVHFCKFLGEGNRCCSSEECECKEIRKVLEELRKKTGGVE